MTGKKHESGLSEAEINQRSEAGQQGITHGAFAFRDRGEAALDKPQQSLYAELSEAIQTRSGVLDLLQRRTIKAVMMCEIIESYIVTEKEKGKELTEIAILNKLPAFQNSAQRCIQALLHEMPNDRDVIDEEAILRSLKDKTKNEETKDD